MILEQAWVFLHLRFPLKENRAVVSGTITHTGSGVFTGSGDFAATPPSYNSTTGQLTLTHPTSNGLYVLTNDQPDTDANITQWKTFGNALSSTVIKFKMFNMDGTQKTLTNPEINRMTVTRYKEQADLAATSVNPNNVSDASGNIWIIGIFKV